MKKGNRKSFNKGFTLVELICVLVVLAVIAAVLVPSLLGYILKVNQKKEINNARTLLEATQAQLVELYAAQGGLPEGTPVISGGRRGVDNGKPNDDCDIKETQFASQVLDLVSMDGIDVTSKNGKPYLFMFAVGSNASKTASKTKNKVSVHDKYTVYYAVYMETEKSCPLYYYNGEWRNDNPRPDKGTKIFDGDNVVLSGPLKGMRLQYYLLANRSGIDFYSNGNNGFWKVLKDKSLYN
ncbi:MAG: prepilin-type N-terminal cleavage/methylation domain-containing protein [Eubacterium sp.]|nr:prepilin-type N-terminal cleavage/methylation domain-containing protein [Eubacterium sp.]